MVAQIVAIMPRKLFLNKSSEVERCSSKGSSMTCRRLRAHVTRQEWGKKSEVVLDIGNPVAYKAGQWHWPYNEQTVIKMLLHTISQPSSVYRIQFM